MKSVLPETSKITEAIYPRVNTGALVGDYVSLKNCGLCFVLVSIQQAHATPPAITIERATDVAGTGSVAIATSVPIWANQDTSLTDTLVSQTAGVAFTTSAAQKNKQVLFMVDPASIGSYDCICVKVAASDASNIVSAIYLLTDCRHQGATPPTAITD